MSVTASRTYYFLFGYHHPDAWEGMQHDRSADLDSTGVIAIQSEDKESALEWGKHLATWYVSKLYLDYPQLTYNWSPIEYACWIETSVPEGCEDCVQGLGEVEINSYPDFEKLKQAMQD